MAFGRWSFRQLPYLGGALLGLYLTWPQHRGAVRSAPELTAAADLRTIASITQKESKRVLNETGTSVPKVSKMTASSTQFTPARLSSKSPRATPKPATSVSRARAEERCIRKGQGRSGADIDEPSKVESPGECQERCQCLEGCAFFTFWKDGSCHVQSTDSSPFGHELAFSGPPFCRANSSNHADLPSPVDLPELQPAHDGKVGPKVYLYDLPPRFQNWGHGPECWSADCVFGGPPVKVQGVEIWGSSQFHMPLMLHYRFLNYAQRTREVDDADVFIIPAYNFKPSHDLPCANSSDLFDTLAELNPRLKEEQWAKAKVPRHLLMDARGWETCNYMWELHMPFRLAHRINIELNGLLEDGPEGWTYNKPFIWYQFPYPAVYHGHAESTPAKLRVKLGGIDRYLWSFSGTGRGQAGFLRQAIMKECTICNRLEN